MSEVVAASAGVELRARLWAALPYVAWTQAVVATAGSLYFSEVMDLQPCVLCWYQRILMYPLAAVLAVGILRRDRGIAAYVLPLTLLGLAIATYHNFITIPLMSLVAFSVINVCMGLYGARKRYSNE